MVEKKEHKRWYNKVSCYPHSIRFHRVPSYHPTPKSIAKRGKITTFSRHSRLRLRDMLSKCFVGDSFTFGVTLTVPWKQSDLEGDLAAYRYSWDLFCKSFRRSFPNSAALFRHELQQRKMPHTHIVAFFSKIDVPGDVDITCYLQTTIFNIWLRSIGSLRGGSLTGFSRNGVTVQNIRDLDAAYRYISDHASKLKQAQLGYPGKQWGCISKKLLSYHEPNVYVFKSQSTLIKFQREISKLCRFRIPLVKNLRKRALRYRYIGFSSDVLIRKVEKVKRCPFGSKLSSGLNGISIQYVKRQTSDRLIRYLLASDPGIYLDQNFPLDNIP